jgi:hypothetical protein
MRSGIQLIAIATASLTVALVTPHNAEAQGRGRGNSRPAASPTTPTVSASVSISVGDIALIREFYDSQPARGVEALPPGIRRNLARGKSLPPGIAKRTPPSDLRSRIRIPERFEIVEVGLDVFLVEAATGLIHDALMDVIR